MFFWKREKSDTKRIQAVSPWQREKRMKRKNNTSFQGLENQKTLEKLLAQRRRRSKRFKDWIDRLIEWIRLDSFEMQNKALLL